MPKKQVGVCVDEHGRPRSTAPVLADPRAGGLLQGQAVPAGDGPPRFYRGAASEGGGQERPLGVATRTETPAPQKVPDGDIQTRPEAAPRGEPTQPPRDRSLDEELKARFTQLALLVEVNATLAGALNAEVVLEQILSRLRERAWLTNASIFLLEPEERQLRCVAESGYITLGANPVVALDGPGLIALSARTAQPVYVPDVSKDPRYLCGDPRIKSEYAVPLIAGSKVLGVLDVESDQLDGIRATTSKLVDQLAPQAALAIERSDLYKKLRASEEVFRSVFEQNYFGVALCNLEGKFSNVNPAFAGLLGYEPAELRGKHFLEITHPDDRPRDLECVKRLLAGKEEHLALETRYLRKSEDTLWGNVVASLIRDSEHRPAYILVMIQDITERKKGGEERARLQEQLCQAQKMEAIGTLTGGIAHDFNNFLGVILGFASLLRVRLKPGDPLLEPVRLIEKSAENAADLTRQLLGLARPGLPQLVPVSIGETLDRVTKIVRRTFDRRIQVEMQLAAELPWVKADQIQLEQAILNLCINARDAMPEGGKLTFATSAAKLGPGDTLRPPECPPGDYVRIAVRDTGVGMPPEVMEHIFQPFFTTKPHDKGSGLGLTMVEGIVRSHGGFVRVESEVGRGTEFTLHLPAIPAGETVELPLNELPAKLQTGSGTVLIVDDEPLVLAFAEEGLKRLGYKVLTAETGKRACELYASRAEEFHCVLLDMVMPEISGLETYQKLREINPQVRVILSSGYSERRMAHQARDAGINAFLGKPYTIETLSLALKRIHQG